MGYSSLDDVSFENTHLSPPPVTPRASLSVREFRKGLGGLGFHEGLGEGMGEYGDHDAGLGFRV